MTIVILIIATALLTHEGFPLLSIKGVIGGALYALLSLALYGASVYAILGKKDRLYLTVVVLAKIVAIVIGLIALLQQTPDVILSALGTLVVTLVVSSFALGLFGKK